MALSTMDFDGYTVCYETEMIDTPTMAGPFHRTPKYVEDPSWAHIDARGHLHSHGTDSWVAVQLPPYWCSDCRDMHDGGLDRYVCTFPGCDETIRPAYVEHGYHVNRQSIPGMKRLYVLRPDGSRVDLTGDETRMLDEVGPEWLPELIDALPAGRWSGPTTFR